MINQREFYSTKYVAIQVNIFIPLFLKLNHTVKKNSKPEDKDYAQNNFNGCHLAFLLYITPSLAEGFYKYPRGRYFTTTTFWQYSIANPVRVGLL